MKKLKKNWSFHKDVLLFIATKQNGSDFFDSLSDFF
jgi:hypothetical protein